MGIMARVALLVILAASSARAETVLDGSPAVPTLRASTPCGSTCNDSSDGPRAMSDGQPASQPIGVENGKRRRRRGIGFLIAGLAAAGLGVALAGGAAGLTSPNLKGERIALIAVGSGLLVLFGVPFVIAGSV